MSTAATDTVGIDRLADRIRGEVVRPDHPDYDDARSVWNGSIDRYPTAVVRCADIEDIRQGLAFARTNDLRVAVRGGGHNVAGFGTCDDGIVLDLRRLNQVTVDPARRVATAGPGTIGAEFDEATQAHGLAATMGVMSTTGVAGLTLGGGIGWLQRAYGLTCDSLLAAEVLTADGELVRASEQDDPELLWGLKGGGGNLGIVTSFEFALHEVGPDVLCGLTAWSADDTADVLRHLRDIGPTLPDEITPIVICRTAPPAPFLPEEVHGQPIVAVAGCYAGPIAEGEEVLAGLRGFGNPVGDAFAVRPYTAFQRMFDASWDPGFQNHWKAEYLAHLDEDAIEVFARYAVGHTSPLSDFKIGMMGGAIARVGETATACPHRDAPFVLNINTRWEDPEESARHVAHTRRFFEEAQAASAGGVYVNFLGDEGADRVRHAYGEDTFARLQALKRRWDPDNVFRLNQNIPPAADRAGTSAHGVTPG